MRTIIRWRKRLKRLMLTGLIGAAPVLNGCLDSDAFKRFRDAYEPGFVAGLSAAVTDPANSQIGFRQLATAFFEGLGAVIDPRTPAGS